MLTHKKVKLLSLIFILILAVILANILISRDLNKHKKELRNFKILLEENKTINANLLIAAEKIKNEKAEEEKRLEELKNNTKTIKAYVTAFNTVPEQTDEDPCQAKFGYICGRDDVVACPRNIPAHSKIIILGKEYECMDVTALKYNGRFDISFDKDIKKAIQFGIKYLTITIYE